MAACDLSIQLDEPRKMYLSGEPVAGTVTVRCDAPVKCNGLELTTYWTTHGRGNIASGDIDFQVVFQGEWEANKEYRYPFTLKTAAWPPTYYGTYLNVSHSVRAQAKLPWKSDPKSYAEFTVVSTTAPEDLKPTAAANKKSGSMIGWIFGWIFGILLLLILIPLLGMLLVFVLPIVAISGAAYWFFRVFLPKQITGSIECSVEPKRVTAGEQIHGQLKFVPKRNVTINGISWTMACHEKCSSGSGSNRHTYSHELLKQVQPLAGATQLRAGEPQSFEFTYAFPETAPPSLKFTDNELNWSCELRIDIPKWPDFVKTFPLTVVPSGKITLPVEGMIAQGSLTTPTPEEQQWFQDVLDQIARCQNDEERNVVVGAIRDQVFTVTVNIIEHWDEPPESCRGETGLWMLGTPRRGDIEVALLWALPGEPPAVDTMNWCCQATVAGFDDDMECLLMRVLPPQ